MSSVHSLLGSGIVRGWRAGLRTSEDIQFLWPVEDPSCLYHPLDILLRLCLLTTVRAEAHDVGQGMLGTLQPWNDSGSYGSALHLARSRRSRFLSS